MKELRKIVGDITVCIVGNKTDLEKNRNVTKEEAEQYACLHVMSQNTLMTHFM